MAELRAELEPPSVPGEYLAHTDGACLGNPDGPGGWAAIVERPGAEPWDLWGHLSSTSNNRAEALGLLAALEWVPAASTLTVRSDSELTVRIAAGKYKAKANPDIWAEITRVRAARNLTLKLEWVRGHAGDPGNERADRMSVLGAVNGDIERLPASRGPKAPRPSTRAVPAEIADLVPSGTWEKDFVQSLARQLRTGRALSPKQQAVVERIRARAPAAER